MYLAMLTPHEVSFDDMVNPKVANLLQFYFSITRITASFFYELIETDYTFKQNCKVNQILDFNTRSLFFRHRYKAT